MTDKVENEEKVVEKSKFAKDLCFDKIVWIFMISCIVGFLVETLWCLIKHGYIESRQSLVWGPFSVAYGMGAVVLTFALYKVKDAPVWKVFGVSFIVGTITEYICSLGQEIVFGSVAWDYSNMPLNINGRVCFLYSCFWGLLGILWIKAVYPIMSKVIEKLPAKLGTIIMWAFIVFFVFDSFVSATAGLRMDKRDAGQAPNNVYEQYLDNHFPDERMNEIYANSQKVNK